MMGDYADCPICLNPMTEADNVYPLLCPTACGYNFCTSCVQHLVDSSKDDYAEASDGNRHVKVQLQCPQCRGNLKETIQDTLLMRRAKGSEKYRHVVDSELNATELRIKHEFVQLYAKDVEHAEARLRKYHKEHGGEEPPSLNFQSLSLEQNESQESNGSARSRQADKVIVDTTLFSGLEYFMSTAEQEYVTQLLTSGDVNQLAQAAQILHGIVELSQQGGGAPHTNLPNRTWQDERRHLEQLANYRKRHPLPARMPKYVWLPLFNSNKNNKALLSFQDDEWDGSIADAFSRVHLTKTTPGMENILSMADEKKLQAKERVKIDRVKGAAGKCGIQKGDVVTHVFGEVFTGNAEAIRERIYELYKEDPDQSFAMVLNAEESTAEILKLRAQASAKAEKESNSL